MAKNEKYKQTNSTQDTTKKTKDLATRTKPKSMLKNNTGL